MTRKTTQRRKPAAFRLEPEAGKAVESTKTRSAGNVKKIEITPFPDEGGRQDNRQHAPMPSTGRRHKSTRWGLVLVSTLGALLSFGVGLAVTGIIEDLFARHAWLGWAGLGLTAITGLAAVMLAGRELAALLRQRRISHISEQVENALQTQDSELADRTQADLVSLYDNRSELAWARQRLSEHDEDILDAPDRLGLAERELMSPLDREAKALIATAAKRVSVLTALSPSALVDISFVAAANLRLMRALAELYGGRPGMLGLIRLGRMVLTHLTLTGGLALSDDMLQQLLGHSLASRISSRLGEGMLNGAMTARIGLAAMQVCRPMPFRALKQPGIKSMVGSIISPGTKASAKKDKTP